MRDIKFRAWDIDAKEMLSWKQIDNYDKEGILHLYDILNEPEKYRVIPMQCTGLHDKNGKEIYEGDILRFTTIDKIPDSEVIYRLGCFCDSHYGWCLPKSHEMEVIGNIHESLVYENSEEAIHGK